MCEKAAIKRVHIHNYTATHAWLQSVPVTSITAAERVLFVVKSVVLELLLTYWVNSIDADKNLV